MLNGRQQSAVDGDQEDPLTRRRWSLRYVLIAVLTPPALIIALAWLYGRALRGF
jgi:hypothetical protein